LSNEATADYQLARHLLDLADPVQDPMTAAGYRLEAHARATLALTGAVVLLGHALVSRTQAAADELAAWAGIIQPPPTPDPDGDR
jgi:hypothetical protein